jgi:signal transduction histidine kinase
MQAMQSTTASGPEKDSGQFAALRHVTRQMKLHGSHSSHSSAISIMRGAVAAPVEGVETNPVVGVAEGAGLAHDAGNLLGALSLYSDLLAMPGVLHEEHREYASELRMLSDRSWAMIDRLVNHARAGRPAKIQGEFSVLPDVIDRCRGLLSRVAGRTVEVSYGVGAFQSVRVAVEAVERILTNLVKNAAEATPWVGAISIHVEGVLELAHDEDEEPRRRVVMSVQDRGCGMDQPAARRLLQGVGATSGNGRGLGFRVVRELVAISNGSLNIESQLEVGTTISAEWYAAKREEVEVQQEELRINDSGVQTLLKGEAGWMACQG